MYLEPTNGQGNIYPAVIFLRLYIRLSRCLYDLQELVRPKARTSDQGAVDALKGDKARDVAWIDAAAVQQGHLRCGLAEQGRQGPLDRAAHNLGRGLRGSCQAGTDGPHRLVGNQQAGYVNYTRQPTSQLLGHHCPCPSCLSLL